MTATQKNVLACLTANVSAARTPAMRRFAQTELDGYRARLKTLGAASKRSRRPGPTWDRETSTD